MKKYPIACILGIFAVITFANGLLASDLWLKIADIALAVIIFVAGIILQKKVNKKK